MDFITLNDNISLKLPVSIDDRTVFNQCCGETSGEFVID